jgi:hypothetical protein
MVALEVKLELDVFKVKVTSVCALELVQVHSELRTPKLELGSTQDAQTKLGEDKRRIPANKRRLIFVLQLNNKRKTDVNLVCK